MEEPKVTIEVTREELRLLLRSLGQKVGGIHTRTLRIDRGSKLWMRLWSEFKALEAEGGAK